MNLQHILMHFLPLRTFTKKSSSTRWFKQHVSDQYVKKAQEEHYRSRAAFKLLQLNEKYRLIREGDLVLDLGSAPGGWSQVALSLSQRQVVAIDLLPMAPLPDCVFLQKDILHPDTPPLLRSSFPRRHADCLLSDMAPNFTNDLQENHFHIGRLNLMTLQAACQLLKRGGHLAMKSLQGEHEKKHYSLFRPLFKDFHRVKPKSSRQASQEIFYVGKGFLPDPSEICIPDGKRSQVNFFEKVGDMGQLAVEKRSEAAALWREWLA